MTDTTASTSTDVVTQDDAERMRKIRAMTGQLVGGSENFIPGLRVNKNPEDDDGNEVPTGVLSFRSKKYGDVYGKRKQPVVMRPYAHRMRYEAYDSVAKKAVGRSVLFSTFKEEAISDNGYMKAGKDSNTFNDTTKSKCKHMFYGTVSGDFTTAKGETVTLENEPVFMKVGGMKFIEISDYIKDFTKKGKILPNYTIAVSAVHLGEGIYNIEFVWSDLTKKLELDEAAFDTLQKFSDYINAENAVITKKYNYLLSKRLNAGDTVGDDIVDDGGTLNDDLVDAPDVDAPN